jgi:hypothetical protein
MHVGPFDDRVVVSQARLDKWIRPGGLAGSRRWPRWPHVTLRTDAAVLEMGTANKRITDAPRG